MAIKKHDFVEIEYIGALKGENEVFDTTKEDVAKEHDLYREGASYAPLVVCVGEQFLIKGLDDFLIGKEIGKEYTADILPEQGFGRKDAKLLQMIPAGKFRQSEVQPFPGLQVNIDGAIGMIKTVSGGRVMVDFNHPLAGRELSYTFTALSIVDDEKRKVDAYLKHLGLDNIDVSVDGGVVTIRMLRKIDDAIEKEFIERIKGIIPSLREIKFVEEKGGQEKEGERDAHSPEDGKGQSNAGHEGHGHEGHQH